MLSWYGSPAMRQELVNPAGRLQWQAFKDVAQVRIRVVSVDACRVQQTHDGRSPLTGAQAASKEPVRSSESNWADLVFYPIVIDGQAPVVQVAR